MIGSDCVTELNKQQTNSTYSFNVATSTVYKAQIAAIKLEKNDASVTFKALTRTITLDTIAIMAQCTIATGDPHPLITGGNAKMALKLAEEIFVKSKQKIVPKFSRALKQRIKQNSSLSVDYAAYEKILQVQKKAQTVTITKLINNIANRSKNDKTESAQISREVKLLTGFFEEDIINRVKTRYGFSKQQPSTNNELAMLLCGIATHLTPTDITTIDRDFLYKDFWPIVAKKCIPKAKQVVEQGNKYTKQKKSRRLYDAVKNDFYAVGDKSSSDRDGSVLESMNQGIISAKYIKKHMAANEKHPEYTRAAQAEYIAHELAYQIYPDKKSIPEAQRRQQQVIPIPSATGKIELYKIDYRFSFDNNGYHGAILTIILPKQDKNSDDAIVMFRGTANAASIKRDISIKFAPGIVAAKKYGLDILKQLDKILDSNKGLNQPGIKPKVAFMGHSLGGADAQNLLLEYVEQKKAEKDHENKVKIRDMQIDLCVFGAPGIGSDRNKLVCKDINKLDLHKDINILFAAHFKDPVAKFGTHLGSGQNINRKKLYLNEKDKGKLAAHTEFYFRGKTKASYTVKEQKYSPPPSIFKNSVQ